jgi:hypothetical protein
MNPSHVSRLAAGLLAALALGATAAAQPHGAAAPSGSVTKSLQGGDEENWIKDPHIHAFYDAVVAACAKGAAKADVPALEAKSRTIFHDFAVSKGVDPAAMQDHLKLIPGQIVQIAKEDPTVLDSYDNFIAALFGPK